MKSIGYTNQRTVLVEMSENEWAALSSLDALIKGKALSIWRSSPPEYIDDREMSDAFAAICEWIQVKDRVNLIRQMANEMDAALLPPKSHE